MFRNSLRARLTLWYTAVLTLVLVSSAAVSYAVIARATSRSEDQSLQNAGGALAAALREETAVDAPIEPAVPKEDGEQDDEENEPPDPPGTVERELVALVTSFRLGNYRFAVFDEARRLIATSGPTDGPSLRDAPPWQIAEILALAERPGGGLTTLPDSGAGARAFAVRETNDEGTYSVVVTHSLEDQEKQLAGVRQSYAVAIPFAILLAALGGSLLTRKSLDPMVRMGDQAERIEATSLHERLKVANQLDEIGRLARIFNALLERLEMSFEQQRRFMADASHELRTPVAIVRGEAEVALSRADRGADDYRESLDIIHDEGKRLTTIVDDLFLLARADAGERPLVTAEFYLDEAAWDSVRAVRTLAERRGVGVACEPSKEMLFQGDEALLRRLLVNLLDNAIKHTPADGEVRVRMEDRGSEYVVTISDTGRGIPAEAQPFVFDRFFRADKARSRAAAEDGSGAGLGLSIARWIAEAHHGRVALIHSDEHGSIFALTLPVPGGAPRGEIRQAQPLLDSPSV